MDALNLEATEGETLSSVFCNHAASYTTFLSPSFHNLGAHCSPSLSYVKIVSYWCELHKSIFDNSVAIHVLL